MGGYECAGNPAAGDPGCGRHFGSITSFDWHLRGSDLRCATDAELIDHGLRLADGRWVREAPSLPTGVVSCRTRGAA